jgi:hypothetical protein
VTIDVRQRKEARMNSARSGTSDGHGDAATRKKSQQRARDAAGGAEGGMASGSAGGPGEATADGADASQERPGEAARSERD